MDELAHNEKLLYKYLKGLSEHLLEIEGKNDGQEEDMTNEEKEEENSLRYCAVRVVGAAHAVVFI